MFTNTIITKYKKLFDFFEKSEKFKFLIWIFLTIIALILEILSIGIIPSVFQAIFDQDFSNKLTKIFNFENFNNQKIIFLSFTALIMVFVLKNLFLIIFNYYQSKFIFEIIQNVSFKLFNQYIYKPYEYFIKNNTSKIIRNVTVDIALFNGAIKASAVLISEIIILIGIFTLLIFINPKVTIFTGILIFFGSIVFLKFIKTRTSRWGLERQKLEAIRIKRVQESLNGNKEIKILNCEQQLVEEFKKNNILWSKIGQYQNFFESLPRVFIEIYLLGIIFIIFSYASFKSTIEIEFLSTFATFIVAAIRVLPSVNRIIGSFQRILYSIPVVDVFYDEIKEYNDKTLNDVKSNVNQTSRSSTDKITNWNSIDYKNINFNYEGSKTQIFTNLNFKINKNSFVMIYGQSGSGKTTLVDIILNILKCKSKDIFVDNEKQDDGNSLNNFFGYVPQKIFFFDDSVENNISIKKRNDHHKRLKECLELAQIKEFVERLPEKEKTNIGEKGIKISGGQAQRIGIARALYNEPEILIFDEATSALDNETEKKFINSLQKLKNKITIIFITHKLILSENFDKVFQIKDKNIIQQK